MKIKIVTDSSADVTPEIRSQLNIVPLLVRFGEKEYLDGIDLDYDSFYEKLESNTDFPSTSQANPSTFQNIYEQTLQEYDVAIVIVVSSKLVGTYQSACLAAEDYEGKIFVVDSLNGSAGTGLLAKRGLELIEQDYSVEEIVNILNKEREAICVFGIPSTLDYLKRGGRISSVSALAGSLLSIKPILGVRDGVIVSIDKTRGIKKAFRILNETIDSQGGIDENKPQAVCYSGNSDAILKDYLAHSDSRWNHADIVRICSSIGTHLGPGAVLVAYYKKQL